jgi:class 3 adenylate cyclase
MASTRRLTAILAADVAGYSRLMGADEEGTHERLKAHRRELVDPEISEHSGRIVKTTGDGMLVEFPSVVDAVRCATEVQRAMIEAALTAARAERRTSVIVIATDPTASTNAGGAWWDVAVPEVSSRAEVIHARAAYDAARSHQRTVG